MHCIKAMNYLGNLECLDLKTTSYDCFFQQIMALCKFYKNEYQKIFLGQYLDIKGECKVFFCVNYVENIMRYYGLKIKSIKPEDYKYIEKGRTYLVGFDITKYPLCNNLEEYDGKYHFAILYDIEGDSYLLYDNFYLQQRYIMSKNDFFDAIVYLNEISYDEKVEISKKEVHKKLLDACSVNAHKIVVTLCERIETWNNKKIFENEKQLLENIQMVFSFINRDADVFQIYDVENLYIDKCIKLLRKLSEDIRLKWYILLKFKLKNRKLNKEMVLKIYHQIEELLRKEIILKRELYGLFTNMDGLRKEIICQLEKYLGNRCDLKESVYEKHDGYTILKLINYWEDQNSLMELSPLLFSGKDTYDEFCSELYAFILQKK